MPTLEEVIDQFITEYHQEAKQKVIKPMTETTVIPRLAEVFFHGSTAPHIAQVSEKSFKEDYPQFKNITLQDSVSSIVGIEFEVEGVPNLVEANPDMMYWNLTTDGSLRNHGIEFVSLPVTGANVHAALLEYKYHVNSHDTPAYTHRTSTHVHLNVRHLNRQQIELLTALYVIYEDILFSFTEKSRHNNPFCVPMSEFLTDFKEQMRNTGEENGLNFRTWPKYSAYNLQNIGTKGTIEFRHMHGTQDIDFIMTWIRLLDCLVSFVGKLKDPTALKNVADEINTLNIQSAYISFTERIFTDCFNFLPIDDITPKVNNQVTLAKIVLALGVVIPDCPRSNWSI